MGRNCGTKVIVLINDLDIRVLERDSGKLIRKLTLDPTRDYQPRGVKPGNSPTNSAARIRQRSARAHRRPSDGRRRADR